MATGTDHVKTQVAVASNQIEEKTMPRTICCKAEPAFQWNREEATDCTLCPECGRQCGPLRVVREEEKRRRLRLEEAVAEFCAATAERFKQEQTT